jgi:hypothetical protein
MACVEAERQASRHKDDVSTNFKLRGERHGNRDAGSFHPAPPEYKAIHARGGRVNV